jgi:hypothetical protein
MRNQFKGEMVPCANGLSPDLVHTLQARAGGGAMARGAGGRGTPLSAPPVQSVAPRSSPVLLRCPRPHTCAGLFALIPATPQRARFAPAAPRSR